MRAGVQLGPNMTRPCLLAAAAILCMTASDARADLLDKTIYRDTPLTHTASLIDTQLSPAQVGQPGPNWEWIVAQRPTLDGQTWSSRSTRFTSGRRTRRPR
jgi:hypothetical protein